MRRSDQLRPQAQLDPPDQRGQSVPLLQSRHLALSNLLDRSDRSDLLDPMGQLNPLDPLDP